MTRPLEGKVIVCTGAGSGIGRAAVDAFMGAGARVGVLEMDPIKTEALGTLGDRVFALTGDATDPASNGALIDQAVERWGRVDTAVTFVGVFDFYAPLADIPEGLLEEAFTEIFATNVQSALRTALVAIPRLRESHGSMIFTLSSSSFYPGRGGVLYVASKFALRGAVAQLAHELAPEVRVNGVAPGGTVATDLRGSRTLGRSEERLDDRPGRPNDLRARTPLQVALTGEDHADAYVYLASDGARGVTGEVIRSDGGWGVR